MVRMIPYTCACRYWELAPLALSRILRWMDPLFWSRESGNPILPIWGSHDQDSNPGPHSCGLSALTLSSPFWADSLVLSQIEANYPGIAVFFLCLRANNSTLASVQLTRLLTVLMIFTASLIKTVSFLSHKNFMRLTMRPALYWGLSPTHVFTVS